MFLLHLISWFLSDREDLTDVAQTRSENGLSLRSGPRLYIICIGKVLGRKRRVSMSLNRKITVIIPIPNTFPLTSLSSHVSVSYFRHYEKMLSCGG